MSEYLANIRGKTSSRHKYNSNNYDNKNNKYDSNKYIINHYNKYNNNKNHINKNTQHNSKYLVLSIITLLLIILLANNTFAYDLYSDNDNYYYSNNLYSATITKDALFTELLVDNIDYIGDDYYDGYDYIYLTPTSLGVPITIINSSYENNTITFESNYANITYTFLDQNISLRLIVKNQSDWLKLYAPINTEKFVSENDSNSASGEDISDYIGIDAAWDNVTFISKNNLKIDFVLYESTNESTNPGVVNYGVNNNIMWTIDNIDGINGFPMRKDNNYTININIRNDTYVKPDTNFNISITPQSTLTANYTINSTYYNVEVKNCRIVDLYFNGSQLDFLGDDLQNSLEGIYYTTTSPTSGIITITNSSYYISNNTLNNTLNDTITCYANNTNITYTFYKDKISLKIALSSTATWTNLYLVTNPDNINKVTNGRNSSDYFNFPTNAVDKSWEDIIFTTIENAKVRFFMKRDHVLNTTKAETDYYNNVMIYAVDNLEGAGFPMRLNNSYSYVLSFDLTTFEPQIINSTLTIIEDPYWYNIHTDNYNLILGKDGVIKDFFLANSTKDLFGDDKSDLMDGMYFSLNPSSGIFYALNNSKSTNSITFTHPDMLWKYTFYETKIDIISTIYSKYPGIYFTPNMKNMISLEQTSTSNILNFTSGNFSSKAWPEVTYTTIENGKLSLYLNNHPVNHTVATEGQTNYYQENQLWCTDNLDSIYGGMPMGSGYSYKTVLLINLSDYTPTTTEIIYSDGLNYSIYASNYTAKLNQDCILYELRLKSSLYNVLGSYDYPQNYPGIYLTTQNPNLGRLSANSMNRVNNTIFCTNAQVNWSYEFKNDEIILTVFNTNVTWLNLYAAFDKTSITTLKDYYSTNNMSVSNLTNANWTRLELITPENGRISVYLAYDHNTSSAKGETIYYNQTPMYSIDNIYSGLPMYKNNYYTLKIDFNLTSYVPSDSDEISYSRSNGEGNTKALVRVNKNYTASHPADEMPLVIFIHPINATIYEVLQKSDIDEEVMLRNWSLIVPELYGRNSNLTNHSKYDIDTDDLSSDISDAVEQINGLYSINKSKIYIVTLHNTGLISVARNFRDFEVAAIVAYSPITNLTKYALDINQSIDGLLEYNQAFCDELSCNVYTCPFEYDRVSPISYYKNYAWNNILLYHNPNNTLINYNQSKLFYDLIISNSDYSNTITLANNSLDDTLENINSTEILNWLETKTLYKEFDNISLTYDTNKSYSYLNLTINSYNPVGPIGNVSDNFSDNISYFININSYRDLVLNKLDITRTNIINTTIDLELSELNISNLYLIINGDNGWISIPQNSQQSNDISMYGLFFEAIFDQNKSINNLIYASVLNVSSNSSWNFTTTANRPYISSIILSNTSTGFNLTNQIWENNILNFTIQGNSSILLNIPANTYNYNWILFRNNSIQNVSNAITIIIEHSDDTNNPIDYKLTADNINPIITFISPSPLNNTIVNTSYFEINVSANEPIISCILNVNGINYGMSQIENTCYVNHTLNLVDATNRTCFVTMQDESHNTGTSSLLEFFIDWNNAPSVPTLNYPSNNSYNNNSSILFNWSASDSDDDNLSFKLLFNSINESLEFNTNNTNISINLSHNQYNFTIIASDYEFNTSSINYTINIDLIAPSINLTSPQNNSNHTQTQINITYNASETLRNCTYSFNQGTNVSCITPLTAIQSQNNLTFYLEDLAYNSNSISISFYVDSINPSLNITSPLDNAYMGNISNQFIFNISDLNNISNCSLLVNGQVNTTNNTITNLNNLFSLNLSHGTYLWDIICFDNYGNSNYSNNRTLIVDLLSPELSIINPLNTTYGPRTFVLNITSNEVLSSCNYSLNGGSYVNCTQNFTGVEGINNLTIIGVDIVGNSNSTFSQFIIDLTPPIIELISPTPNNDSNISNNYVTIRINNTNGEISNLSSCNITFGTESNMSSYPMTLISPNICEKNFTNLGDNNTYIYYITSTNIFGNSNNTINYTFNVNWNNAPSASTILTPNANNYTNNATVYFSWNQSSDSDNDPVEYSLYIYTNANLSSNASIYNTTSTNMTIVLVNETIYSWFVLSNDSILTNSSQINNFTIDTTSPIININLTNKTWFNTTAITINVNSTENWSNNYNLSDNNNSLINTFNLTNNTLIYTSNININAYEENNTFSIYVSDRAGNMDSKTINFYVDSIAPNITLITQGNIRTKNLTNKIFFEIGDKTLNNCSLLINHIINTTINSSILMYNSTSNTYLGNFTIEINNSVSNQTILTWSITCNDLLNHTSTSASYILDVDNSAPNISTSPNSNIEQYTLDTIEINTSSIDPDFDSCTYIHNYDFIDDGFGNISNNNNTYNTCNEQLNLSQGLNTIIIYSNDTLNNIINKTINITVDSINPNITLQNFISGNTTFTKANYHNISFIINDSNNLSCKLYLDDYAIVSQGNYTPTLNQTLNVSSNNINNNTFLININSSKYWLINCSDTFHNHITINNTLLFKNIPPNISVNSPSPNTYLNITNITLELTIDEYNIINITTNTESYITNLTNINLTLNNSLNNISITAIDIYENSATYNFSFYVDTIAPILDMPLLNYGSINYNLTFNITKSIPTICILNVSNYENLSVVYLLNLSNTTGFGFEFETPSTNTNITIINNLNYTTLEFNRTILNDSLDIQQITSNIILNDSIYTFMLRCEDYAKNINSINGTIYMDGNIPSIYSLNTNGSEINIELGEKLFFDIRDMNITNIRYAFIEFYSNNTLTNNTFNNNAINNPSVPYFELIIDTNTLNNKESYLLLINATDSSNNTNIKNYTVNINTTSITLIDVTASLPYGYTEINSTFYINYTSLNNISNITVNIYGPQNNTIYNSIILLINHTYSGINNYYSSFTYNLNVTGNYTFEIELIDIDGKILRPETDDFDYEYQVFTGRHNSTFYLTSPSSIVDILIYYGPITYNMSLGTTIVSLPNLSMSMNITTNESLSAHIPQLYSNFSITSMYFRKINSFVNQSYYNSSKFVNYDILNAYSLSINNISNEFEISFVISNTSEHNISDYSKIRIFKAPFNEVTINYTGSNIITPQMTGNIATISIDSFSVFVVLEDTTIVAPPVAGGGGGATSGGGGGGISGMPLFNKTINTTINTSNQDNNSINVSENVTHLPTEENTDLEKITKQKINIMEIISNVLAIDKIKSKFNKHPALIIWAGITITLLGFTAGFVVKGAGYRKYSKYTIYEQIVIINNNLELASQLMLVSKNVSSKDLVRFDLIKEQINTYDPKEHNLHHKELSLLNNEIGEMVQKYRK